MKYNPRYFINTEEKDAVLAQQLNRVFNQIDSRFNDLEQKVFKGGKKEILTRAQLSALLHELGVYDYVLGKGVSQKKIAALLGKIFNASPANIEKDLSQRHNADAEFKNEEAYTKAVQLFKEFGMTEFENKAQKTLQDIENTKGK